MGIPSRDGDQWAPSSHYPFAELLTNSIISWKERLHVPWYLQLLPKEHPLITGLWRSGELMFGPMIIRAVETVLGIPQHCTDSTHKEGVWKRPVGQVPSGPVEVLSGKRGCGHNHCAVSLHIPAHCYLPKRDLTSLIGTLVFIASIEGYICMGWFLWPVRVTLAGFTELSSTEREFLNSHHPQGTAGGSRPRSTAFVKEGVFRRA